jgi:hypothetical protein
MTVTMTINKKRIKSILWDMDDKLKGNDENKSRELLRYCFDLFKENAIDIEKLQELVEFVNDDYLNLLGWKLEIIHVLHDIPFMD